MKNLLLTILTFLLPLVAFADAVEIDGIYYNLNSDSKEAEVASNPSKYKGIVEIPVSVTYDEIEFSVTSIGSSAFSSCYNLTSITIPNSVTLIGNSAFKDCSGLSYITIPNSVTSIGNSAFYNCIGLTSIIIPNSMLSLGDLSFCGCTGMTSLSLPNSVTMIGGRAFKDCNNLTSVTIPNQLTSISYGLFLNCTSLSSIIIPNSVTEIGYSAFKDCTSLTSVSIPNSVTSIGNSSFEGCNSLTFAPIPDNVTYIGDYAFRYCKGLTSVTIPSGVTSIGPAVFQGCSGLTSLTISSSVTSIGYSAFQICSGLTSITIPNNVTTINKYAFWGCSGLTSITIGSAIKKINSQSFAECPKTTDVFCFAEEIPETDGDAFQDSNIEYATLHVPAESVNAYKVKLPWKNFKSIVALDGEIPETPKCATPTISYQNGQLSFSSETEGAKYVTTITDNDIKTFYEDNISLSVTYTITVYATKSGYEDSDIATATLCWIDQQPETEGITNGIAQIPARPVLIKSDLGQITVEGVDDQTSINLFTTDGKLAGSATSHNGSASIESHWLSGTTAIVKIGDRSVKILVK